MCLNNNASRLEIPPGIVFVFHTLFQPVEPYRHSEYAGAPSVAIEALEKLSRLRVVSFLPHDQNHICFVLIKYINTVD